MNDEKQFIEENMNLVYFLIQKYYPAFIHDSDIIQCGMVGLCEAANRFDESKSKFSNYAKNRILGAIKDELRRRNKYSCEISLDSLLERNKNDED